jgi:hypothetical protein
MDWTRYVAAVRTRSHISRHVGTLDHPAAHFLAHLHEHGVPVWMADDDWSLELLNERAAWGAHQSTKAHVGFVLEEMADFDAKSFWMILTLEAVKHLPNL